MATGSFARWTWVVIPLIGAAELATHLSQVAHPLSAADFQNAKAATLELAKSDDLVIIAPEWAEPLAREGLGSNVMTLERAAFADVSRFSRAVELSVRGKHRRELEGWKTTNETSSGPITIRSLENPSPRAVLSDFVTLLSAGEMRAFMLDGSPCAFSTTGAQTGGLGFGPAIPASHFTCGGTQIGISVVTDMNYRPHRCIYAPPSGTPFTLLFSNVKFGDALVGHHALYVEAERNKDGAPVSISFTAGNQQIGRAVHNDGDSWSGFEFSTSELKGQRADVSVRIETTNTSRRMYCFEATTR